MQVGHWPAPEHRTPALAQQGASLYLALYFVPSVLHRDAPLMRTLVASSDPSHAWRQDTGKPHLMCSSFSMSCAQHKLHAVNEVTLTICR